MRLFLKYILILLNLLAVIAVIMAYLSMYIDPGRFYLLSLFGIAYPLIFAVNLFFVVYWAFLKNSMAFFSLIAVLFMVFHFFCGVRIKSKNLDQKGGIAICSYNIKNFKGINDTDKRLNRVVIQSFLQKQNLDIVCLQEIDSFSIRKFIPFLSLTTESPKVYSTSVGEKTDVVIFSRYPIIGEGKIKFEKTPNTIVYADLKIQDDTIRIYNCHLQSYQFHIQDINREMLLANKTKFKDGIRKRKIQVEELKKHIHKTPFPVIVCGDFNAPPISYTYHQLKKEHLTDAFNETGGIKNINTYHKLVPVRIDYILYGKEFNSYGYHIKKINSSDHYPIYSKLLFKNTIIQ